MQKILSSFLILVAILTIGCYQDEDITSETSTTSFKVEVVEEINASIVGYVVDEQNTPIPNAKVKIYSANTTTDENGMFVFNKKAMDKQGTYITVEKEGYFLGSDMVYPSNAYTTSKIKMMALGTPQKITSAEGGTLSIAGGAAITFDKNSFANADQSSYEGTVYVYAKLIAANNDAVYDLMPGGLIGDDAKGKTVVLGTAGMMAIELRDASGKKLNLLKGKSAKLSIPNTSTANLKSIATWSFDEAKGRWSEEGLATLVENNYEFEVSHFSFWNCDAPFPLINLCGGLKFKGGDMIINGYLIVEVDGLGAAGTMTNSEGLFCGKVPKGKKLKFYFTPNITCGEKQLIGEYGPFDENTQLTPFEIDPPADQKLFKLKNTTVTCDGLPLQKSGIVVIQNGSFVFYPAFDGRLEILDLSYLTCTGLTSLTFFGLDLDSKKASAPLDLDPGTYDNLIFDVCATSCDFDLKFKFNCIDRLEAIINGGVAPYSYKWSDGSTLESLKLPSIADSTNSTYCLTVTDATGCSKSYCDVATRLSVLYTVACGPEIQARVQGGTPPYQYLWSTGDQSATLSNNVTAYAQYTITVTDQNTCTTKGNVDVYPQIQLTNNVVSCDGPLYSLEPISQSGVYYYIGSSGTTIQQLDKLSNLDLFTTGFNYQLFGNLANGNCTESLGIKLPQVDEIGVSSNNACNGCSEGYFVVSTSTLCYQCEVGNISILKEDKTTDVTDANTMKKLSPDKYYIIVKDKVTGCYIGIKQAEIK